MSEEPKTRRPMWSDWAVILSVFAAVVFGGAWLGKIGTYAGNLGAASVVGAGAMVTRSSFCCRNRCITYWSRLTSSSAMQ